MGVASSDFAANSDCCSKHTFTDTMTKSRDTKDFIQKTPQLENLEYFLAIHKIYEQTTTHK